MRAGSGSVADLLARCLSVNGDLAGLGALGARDAQGQNSRVVVGTDVLGVGQDDLPAEHAQRALGELHLHIVALDGRSMLGLDRQHGPPDVDVERLGGEAGQVPMSSK